MPAPNYKLTLRAWYLLKQLRTAQHRYSHHPCDEFQRVAHEVGKNCDALLREGGETLHPATTEQPMLFLPPAGGRR